MDIKSTILLLEYVVKYSTSSFIIITIITVAIVPPIIPNFGINIGLKISCCVLKALI